MERFDPASVLVGCDLLDGTGGVATVRRDVVAVDGPDSGVYLQGQLSQEVVAIAGPSVWSFLLAPSGKVDAWLRVHRLDADHHLLEVESGHGDAVVARLRRFLLRTDATIADPQQWTSLACRWDPSTVRVGVGADHALVSPVVAPGDAGIDVLLAPDENAAIDLPAVPEAAFDRHRIARGVSRLGAELGPDTIPAEAGQWVIDASVSFTKGCYTGQELVARVDSRGAQVPRPIRLLRLDDDPTVELTVECPVEPGASVRVDGERRGTVTSFAPRLGAGRPALALAPLARAVAVGDRVEVETPRGPVSATVLEPGTVR
ncbi:MAG: YgfZ/GcvT domain-containing protein [Acidimicrobiia bacterium]